jgi:DNA-binding transcriptional LysR family regulator
VHPLAAVTVFGPLIARFSDAYPLIELDVSVDVSCRDIVSEHFDAGIQFRSNIAQDMIAVPVAANFRVVTVAAPGYLQRGTSVGTPADLSGHNCIRYRWDNAVTNNWSFTGEGLKTDVAVDGSLSVNDHALALRAVLDGVGIAQLPYDLVAPLINEGKLVPVLSDWAPEWPGFYLYYSSRRHVPVKLRSLVDLVRTRPRGNVAA